MGRFSTWPRVTLLLTAVLILNPLGLSVLHAAFVSNEQLSRNIWGPIAWTIIVLLIAAGFAEWKIRRMKVEGRTSWLDAFGDARQIPLYYCLAAYLYGYALVVALWMLLGRLLWLSYDDTGVATDVTRYVTGSGLVPPLVGWLFFLATLICLLSLRLFNWRDHPKLFVTVLSLAPGLILTLMTIRNVRRDGTWEYPGLEIAVLLMGLVWSGILNGVAAKRQPLPDAVPAQG